MHEMSIAMELMQQLESLAREHAADRIEQVAVAAGVMRQIVPEALQLAFRTAATATCAEGATLVLDIVSVLAECRLCGHRFEPEQDSFLCPHCRKADVAIIEGNDIILTSVTFHQRDGDGDNEED